jgi:hypothetical protein
MAHKAFGRRDSPNRRTPALAQARSQNVTPVPSVERASALETPSVEEELQEWKNERRRVRPFQVPWGPLSLMASLSFGIASFVLPDSLNDTFGTLLDVLSGLALLAWFARFRQQRRMSSNQTGTEE